MDFDGYTDSVMDTVAATPTMAVQRQRQAKASLKGINEALPAIDKGLDTASEVGAQARATQQQLENKWTTTPATPATLPKVVRQSEAAKMAAEGQALETEINAIDANLANAPTLTADQMKTQRTQAKRLMGRRSQLAKSVGLKNDAHDADIQKLLTDPKEQAEIGTITASLNSNQAHLTDRTEQLKKRRYELAEKENKHASAVTAGAKELSDTDYDARLKELEDLKRRGAIFIEEIDEIPDGSLVIFSAHGVSNKVEVETKERNLDFYDATCPLVTKVHMEVVRHARAKRDIILIGHEGHPEVEGTMGRHVGKKNSNIYLVQDNNEASSIQIRNYKNLAIALSLVHNSF